jgi:prephenate dehydratase
LHLDAFKDLSPSSPLAVIPQENSIFGTVVETYDLLRSPDMGVDKFVRGEIALEVQHCLIARRGVELSNITKVLSHEQVTLFLFSPHVVCNFAILQALGQCSQYLGKNLPHAALVKTTSTAEAAKCLLSPEYNSVECAAICSTVCVAVFDGLQILAEGIQNSTCMLALGTNFQSWLMFVSLHFSELYTILYSLY